LLGDRVKHWAVLNEGLTFTVAGHLFGMHAPGRAFKRNFLPALHHCLLAQGEAARAIKAADPSARVGTVAALAHVRPASEREADVAAAERCQAFCRMFVDPVVGRGYPISKLRWLSKIDRYLQPGDLDCIAAPMDFLGLNHYFPVTVKSARWVPFVGAIP